MKKLIMPIMPILIIALVAACSSSSTDKTSAVTINIGKGLSGSSSIPDDLRAIDFTISAPDMLTMEREVAVSGKTGISETFDVPVGSNRRVLVQAWIAGGLVKYWGEAYATLDGSPVTLDISMKYSDVNAPPSPPAIFFSGVASDRISLYWNASKDDYKLGGYNVYRDGSLIASTFSSYYSDGGLRPSTEYCYSVSAYDWVGNESVPSPQACRRTKSLLTVWAWGNNSYGQLGGGLTASFSAAPTEVSGLKDFSVSSVAAGGGHALAIGKNNTVRTWGYNEFGQLGDGTTVNRATPVGSYNFGGSVKAAAGENHSVSVKVDGTVWTSGSNRFGQLGIDSTVLEKYEAVQATCPNMNAVGAGDNHSLSVATDGKVYAWGLNLSGQLGDGTQVSKLKCVQVPGISNAVAVSGGKDHSIALIQDGTVWAWGYNGYGQIGNSTVAHDGLRLTPIRVEGISNIVSISAGTYHNLALDSGGSVWSWGRNNLGQLGDGTTFDRYTPVKIAISGVSSIAAGGGHSLAAKPDHTVWGWGDNFYGQLGNGDFTYQTSPVQALGLYGGYLSDALSVEAGKDFSLVIVLIDNVPPSVPSMLTAVPSGAQIALSWTASTDDFQFGGYRVYRDDDNYASPIAVISGTIYTDTGLPSGEHCYKVSAYDFKGNESAKSAPLCATIPP